MHLDAILSSLTIEPVLRVATGIGDCAIVRIHARWSVLVEWKGGFVDRFGPYVDDAEACRALSGLCAISHADQIAAEAAPAEEEETSPLATAEAYIR